MRRTLVGVLIVLTLAVPASAETPKTISWDNLLPDLAPVESPFFNLNRDHQYDLRVLANIRAMKKQGFLEPTDIQFKEGIELTEQLEKAGLNVDELLKEFDRLIAEYKKRDKLPAEGLNGKRVKLPGYALPLEMNDMEVSEILLVPDVGACIHTPPPPPNQIVYVKLQKPYKADHLFEPVWVTGKMLYEKTHVEVQIDVRFCNLLY